MEDSVKNLKSTTAEPVSTTVAPATRASEVGQRVLVVDDNADGAEMLATMLALLGHEAMTAHDGPEALAAARSFGPDVVFLDIGLPEMDGYEVAKRLRADAVLAKAHLVALTGWGSEDDKKRTLDAGFDMHLTKPIEPSALTQVFAKLSSAPSGPVSGS
jgi:CheY-like chemotaxis protein